MEKPCSHDMFEAKQIVAAAQKYNRLVQHGTNSRSSIAREAVQNLREGLIGERLHGARPLLQVARHHRPCKPVEPVPAGVHYDLWLGPAPEHAFTQNRFHYNWHWFWDYGNGDMGNQGIHQVDVCPLGSGREVSEQGQRHRRTHHVRRRPGDAQRAQRELRIRRRRHKK